MWKATHRLTILAFVPLSINHKVTLPKPDFFLCLHFQTLDVCSVQSRNLSFIGSTDTADLLLNYLGYYWQENVRRRTVLHNNSSMLEIIQMSGLMSKVIYAVLFS